MSSYRRLAMLVVCLFALSCVASPQNPQHKAIIDRLNGLADLSDVAWRFHISDMPHGEAVNLDDSAWDKVKPDHKWTGGSAWFRLTIVVPEANKGYSLADAALRLESSSDDDVILYVNGSRVAMGPDVEPTLVAEHLKPGDRIVVAVKVLALSGEHRSRRTLRIESSSKRPDPFKLAKELQVSEAILETLADDKPIRDQQLESAFLAIDMSALENADPARFDRSLEKSHGRLLLLRDLFQQYSIRGVGNAHIDMAWLWPATETVDVVKRTFSTALQLMDEYPDYTFTQSSAQANAWLEEKYPDIFEGIKKRVQEGRWELVGGMWVEPDLNMPDGESIVRQLLIGKRYFREKFATEIRVGWNPDSFGYNWQLPQIYKKSGVDYFVTQKIYWNDTTKFPYKLFWWESPDGSRVLTYFPHDYVNSLEPVRMARDLATYLPQHKELGELMHLYGIGDHGGGPTRFMLDRGKRWTGPDAVYPKLTFGTALGFFKDVETRLPQLKLPVWNSELYLEYHRGVFTTQAATKMHNRRSEELILNAEKYSAMASLYGLHYPGIELTDAWKKILFNQFHDIAAGSGINAIYRDADRDYAEVAHIGQESMDAALHGLSQRISTNGVGVALIVFNPLAWKRNDVVEAEVQLPNTAKSIQVVDSVGKTVAFQIIERRANNTFKVVLKANDIPSLGYEVFHVTAGVLAKPVTDLTATATTLENKLLRVVVDAKSGCITSMFDKTAKRESIAPGTCGNLLQAFRDKPKDWDAWNIDSNFEDEKWDINTAEEVTLIETGPVRASIRVVRKFQKSTFTQVLRLYAGIPRLDVVTDADWNEKHILLKAAITIPVQSDHATYEIPYGSIERPTTRRTPEEKAKFEVPALRWADYSDSNFGVSLLNDSKYGYDAKDNVLRLSLLRSPIWPDPHADEGKHHFTYSFYPHGGGWKTAETVRQGYQLNYKLIAMTSLPHGGTLPAKGSFVEVGPADLVVTAMKKAEDDHGLVLRLYEFAGKSGTATFKFSNPVDRAFDADLMEHQQSACKLDNGVVSTPFVPYEIKTIKVFFKPEASH